MPEQKEAAERLAHALNEYTKAYELVENNDAGDLHDLQNAVATLRKHAEGA